ncbi:5018_t:CDS:2 [Ambispora gerdemannii]|uniref:5018_t:CDS:1 n=1 Tax=Ambispora gerdemannii TaxID=144530 RepID=A0A9N9ECI3_9GLOM|nr:5018_t:CDS:2 [Ambispora gerdemannii]
MTTGMGWLVDGISESLTASCYSLSKSRTGQIFRLAFMILTFTYFQLSQNSQYQRYFMLAGISRPASTREVQRGARSDLKFGQQPISDPNPSPPLAQQGLYHLSTIFNPFLTLLEPSASLKPNIVIEGYEN